MKPASTFQLFFLTYLSRPAHERPIYRALRRQRPRSIVEIGIGDGRRTFRMLSLAQRYRPQERLSYLGIDLFEGRTTGGPGLTLKEAHRQLTKTGVHLRLVPGDPAAALARCANLATETDLIVINSDHDPSSLERAWFYVPRLLHAGSLVLLENFQDGARRIRRLSPSDVTAMASVESHRRAA